MCNGSCGGTPKVLQCLNRRLQLRFMMSIKFKKDREEVLSDINQAVQNQLYQIQNASYSVDSQQLKSHMQNLPWLIGQAVTAAFRKMLESQYTDEDFEKDLGLNEQGKNNL